MKIVENYKVPTGNILVAESDVGLIEFLSIGDYGKEKNIKADFLGLKDEINGVPNGDIMPLEEKWVITISSQYGCSMGCTFCDVPKVGAGVNATIKDLREQIELAIGTHPEVKNTKRLNIHYARMGEPTFNEAVIYNAKALKNIVAKDIKADVVHPVISTMLPRKNKNLYDFLHRWCDIKNYTFDGDAGLQFSINSTCDKQRYKMFDGSSWDLQTISDIGRHLPKPKGRKYALNFALADDYIVDEVKLRNLFDPRKFMIKITPLHKTMACNDNNIVTSDGYISFTPYKKIERRLKEVGFDVLVFIPSEDEDKGRITCGNAILSGTRPHKTL